MATVMTKDKDSPHDCSQGKCIEGVENGSQSEVVEPEIAHGQDQSGGKHHISHYIIDREGYSGFEAMGWKLLLDLR